MRVKIGITTTKSPDSRLNSYITSGGINLILVCNVDSPTLLERAIHVFFYDFYDDSVSGQEWFIFNKKDEELIYRVLLLILSLSNSVYMCEKFTYKIDLLLNFHKWLTKNNSGKNNYNKSINAFLKNKLYIEYIKFIGMKDFKKKYNKYTDYIIGSHITTDSVKCRTMATKVNKADKANVKHKKQNKQNVCYKNDQKRYVSYTSKNGRATINWNLFFDDNSDLLNENVFLNYKGEKYTAKFIKLSKPINGTNYGVLYKNKEYSLNQFCKLFYSFTIQAVAFIRFKKNGKTIKRVFDEMTGNNIK